MKLLWLAFLMSALAEVVAAQSVDAEATISRLAQAAQTSIDFTEIRFSPLLQEPLVVAGTLGYFGPQALDRHVSTPYREDSEIRSDSVRVNREGEPERRFALRRAPELQGLLKVISALLAGDHAALSLDFALTASGTEAAWQFELTPHNTSLRERIQRIRINGNGDAPRCLWIFQDESSFSVMLLGDTAHSELLQALTREWLLALCAM